MYYLSMDKVVIVMPVWNEAKNVGEMIGKLIKEEFPKINAEMHLLVVDNHSKDGTTELVEEASKKYKNVGIIQQGDKSGLGWAYVAGFEYAIDELKADAILEMDADGQHPAEYVKSMVDAYLAGADYVIGSRYVPGGSIPKEWGLSRKFFSFFGNLFIRIVWLNFKIHDMTTGFRLTRVDGVLDKIKLHHLMALDRFAYKVDLLYQSLKLSKKTVEVPLEFRPRIAEKSKFNIKEMITTFKIAIILGIKDKARFIKFGVVGGVGFIVNYVGLELLRRVPVTQLVAAFFTALAAIPVLQALSTASFWATALATEAAIVSNFIFNNIWTFKEEKITKVLALIGAFLKFNFTSLAAVVFQPFVVGQAVILFGDTSLVRFGALLFALVALVIPWNYTMYNLFVWKTWKLPKFLRRG